MKLRFNKPQILRDIGYSIDCSINSIVRGKPWEEVYDFYDSLYTAQDSLRMGVQSHVQEYINLNNSRSMIKS